MIIATLRLTPASGYKERFVSALKVISAQAEGTPGCLQSALYQDVWDEDILVYWELWASDEDLTWHLKTEHYRNLLILIELSTGRPELHFYDVAAHRGLEAVVAARLRRNSVS